MTFDKILNFASTSLTPSSTDSRETVIKSSNIGRLYQGYPENPYNSDMESLFYPPYGMYNHGYGLKYGGADASSGYGHSGGYGGYPGGGGGGGGHGMVQHSPDGYHQQPQYHSGGGGGGGGYGGGGHSYAGGGGGGHSYASADSQSYGANRHHEMAGQRRHHKSKGTASAMSALTLLAFLFFLNILQSCLKEHMMSMNPTVMVMTAGGARQSMHQGRKDNGHNNIDTKVTFAPDYSLDVEDYSEDRDLNLELVDDSTSHLLNKTIESNLKTNGNFHADHQTIYKNKDL